MHDYCQYNRNSGILKFRYKNLCRTDVCICVLLFGNVQGTIRINQINAGETIDPLTNFDRFHFTAHRQMVVIV